MLIPIFIASVFALSLISRYFRSSTPGNGKSMSDKSSLSKDSSNGLFADNFTLNRNLTYHRYKPLSTDIDATKARPLAVLFSWLFAKDRHLDKYRKLYIDRGFDVLTVKPEVSDLLFPTVGSQRIAANVVKFLATNQAQYSWYVFHTFSVGAYQMGEVFVQMYKNENSYIMGHTKQTLKGIIYDSAMDVNEAPIGLSRAATSNAILQALMATAMSTYMKLFHKSVTEHYNTSSNAIHEHVVRCPALVLLSRDDVVANYRNTFQIVDKWRNRGVSVMQKCWDSSPHVSHYFKYPEEYRQLVNDFLKQICGDV